MNSTIQNESSLLGVAQCGHHSEFELSITSIVSEKLCNLLSSPEYQNQRPILTLPFRERLEDASKINQINRVNSSAAEIYGLVLSLEAYISKLVPKPPANQDETKIVCKIYFLSKYLFKGVFFETC